MPQHYPFSAVLGCEADAPDDMGLALVLTTISPEIGGVLVRGEKGTAKSTTVRALAAVLPPIEVYAADRFSVDPADPAATSPDGPFGPEAEVVVRPVRLVELPVGATEDRVLGSLHLERALSHGKVEYEPGLLARAHRGILYVDEVNLLHDHLVDLLLDAAAMGQVTVERDGVSVEHAARFVLIGTMNPEEGELRPQLLDRFGLTVEVAAPREPGAARRGRAAADWRTTPTRPPSPRATATRDRVLTERVESARERLAKVRLTEPALMKIAEVCAAFEVDGLRADIVTARTAVAHAAWEGRDEVSRADIRRAALLALPHRRRRNPFDAPGLDEDLLDQILGDDELPPEPPEGPAPDEPPGQDGGEETHRSWRGAGADTPAEDAVASNAATSAPSQRRERRRRPPSGGTGATSTTTVGATAPYRPRLLEVQGLGEGEAGRRSRAVASTGRRVGARPGASGSLDLVGDAEGGGRQAGDPPLAAAGGSPSRQPTSVSPYARGARPTSSSSASTPPARWRRASG